MIARVIDRLAGQLLGLKFLDTVVVAAHVKDDRLAAKFQVRGKIVRCVFTGDFGLLRHGIRILGRIGALVGWSLLHAAAGGQQENSGKDETERVFHAAIFHSVFLSDIKRSGFLL